ncbi:DUF6221 family protein [Rhodococcus tibetensis]|uniref:DUF6221 family protein n=1 Tax=Rhodococcus tibetensis TaxID=2965064 RepID=A0ABT1QCC9_9NOCA|nr:DUF6221 family protein [Rhodococcus sp. FXJ9.536]MCQ4119872.1 DUF6221 family protein [Rhodococcus sp. FXJ9.536]
MDIVDFLNARLDEDERIADEARCLVPGKWESRGIDLIYADVDGVAGTLRHEEDAVHIARHDPARVLREVAAKRKIVETYREAREHPDYRTDPVLHAMVKQHKQFALLPLTEVYREHPDFGRWRS